MKKYILIAAVGMVPSLLMAQGAMDAYNMSQSDLKGTARFMSMGGAFGALGGDLSTLTQNPAGIGVYRGNEVGVTMDINIQSTNAKSQGVKGSNNQTKVYCNNVGYVGTARLDGYTMPTFSWGVSYNRASSFDRVTKGGIPNMGVASLSNYIAGKTNMEGLTDNDLGTSDNYDPYNDPIPGTYNTYAPWLSILGYDAYLITPYSSGGSFHGLVTPGSGTVNPSGYGSFATRERGYIDEYSINFGGNFCNTVYWGIGFGITDINYTSDTYYEENWTNATIPANDQGLATTNGNAYFSLANSLHNYGTGFNMKFGVIVKPINELRLGLAVHTPTWYAMNSEYYGDMDYYYKSPNTGTAVAPDPNYDLPGTPYGSHEFNFRAPWRLIASAAGVIGGRGIISVDYEYKGYNNMSFSDDWGTYEDVRNDIQNYYKATNTVRVGAEYRVTPGFSLRAGYSYTSSPVQQGVKNGNEMVYTAGTIPSYYLDDATQYITCGLGYRYKSFYADAAYVHKNRKSTWHAFSPVIANGSMQSVGAPSVDITDHNNSIVLSIGFKF